VASAVLLAKALGGSGALVASVAPNR
jgi:hypothetical protein